MSAEIPWTVGPGESLPKAPAVGLCGEPEPAQQDAAQNAPEPDPALLAMTCEAVLEAVCAQRDRALLDLQQARAAVVYWRARAEGRS